MIAPRRIVVDAEHVARLDAPTATPLWRIGWADVREVAAWKDDVFSYDIICLGFRTQAGGFCWCDEEDEGWDDLLAVTERVLGVQSEDWWKRVAFPAFRQNWTVLWQSAGSTVAER